jgi:hypothetical protein
MGLVVVVGHARGSEWKTKRAAVDGALVNERQSLG